MYNNAYVNVDVNRESGTANVLRIVFTVLAVFMIGLFTNSALLGTTFLNTDFWRRTINSEEVRSLLLEEIDVSFNDLVKIDSIDSTIMDEEFSDAFVDMVLDEVLDMLLEGDAEVDEERFYEFFDEYEDVIFGGMSVPSSISVKAREQSLEMFEESLKKYEKEFKRSESYSVMHSLDGFKSFNTTMLVTSAVFIIIMVAILIPIHKNKFKVMRNMGISMTIIQGLNFLGWLLILMLMSLAGKSAAREAEAIQVMVGSMKSTSGVIVLVLFFLLLAGIAMIVGGSIGAKRFARRNEEQMPMQPRGYY